MRSHMTHSIIFEKIMMNRWNPKYQHKWKYDWGFDDALGNDDFN